MSTTVKKGEDLKQTLDKFEQFVHLLSDFFTTTKSDVGENVKKSNFDKSTQNKFLAQLQTNERQKRKHKLLDTISQEVTLYELSFLKDMISGKFNGLTAASFDTQKDKNLFEKFNVLTKKQQKEKYQEYKKELDSPSLK